MGKSKEFRISKSQAKKIEEDSFVQALKAEWKLFWESLKSNPESLHRESQFEAQKLGTLSLEDIRRLTRSLSTHRRRLNQELEFLKSEIDQHTRQLEQCIDDRKEQILSYINALNDRGQTMSSRLQQLDLQLRATRSREDELLQNKSH